MPNGHLLEAKSRLTERVDGVGRTPKLVSTTTDDWLLQLHQHDMAAFLSSFTFIFVKVETK